MDNVAMRGLLAQGDSSRGSGKIIGHFAFDDNGRIKQETAYYDVLTFMRRLGLGRRENGSGPSSAA